MEHIVGYPKTDNRYGGIASNKTREPTNSTDRAYGTNVVPFWNQLEMRKFKADNEDYESSLTTG